MALAGAGRGRVQAAWQQVCIQPQSPRQGALATGGGRRATRGQGAWGGTGQPVTRAAVTQLPTSANTHSPALKRTGLYGPEMPRQQVGDKEDRASRADAGPHQLPPHHPRRETFQRRKEETPRPRPGPARPGPASSLGRWSPSRQGEKAPRSGGQHHADTTSRHHRTHRAVPPAKDAQPSTPLSWRKWATRLNPGKQKMQVTSQHPSAPLIQRPTLTGWRSSCSPASRHSREPT